MSGADMGFPLPVMGSRGWALERWGSQASSEDVSPRLPSLGAERLLGLRTPPALLGCARRGGSNFPRWQERWTGIAACSPHDHESLSFLTCKMGPVVFTWQSSCKE